MSNVLAENNLNEDSLELHKLKITPSGILYFVSLKEYRIYKCEYYEYKEYDVSNQNYTNNNVITFTIHNNDSSIQYHSKKSATPDIFFSYEEAFAYWKKKIQETANINANKIERLNKDIDKFQKELIAITAELEKLNKKIVLF